MMTDGISKKRPSPLRRSVCLITRIADSSYRCIQPCTSAMIPARSMVRVLATLLLSARLEAFSLHPVHRRGAFSASNSKAAVLVSAAPAVAQRGTSEAVAPSLWTGASGRGRSTALDMNVDTVAEVTVTDLQDREFQVTTCPAGTPTIEHTPTTTLLRRRC